MHNLIISVTLVPVNSRTIALSLLLPALSCAAQAPDALDAKDIEKKVNASFYHPAGLAEISCDVQMQWDSFFHIIGIDPDSDKAKAFRSAKFHFGSVPKGEMDFSEEWPKETSGALPDGLKTQFSGSIYQMVKGFFQSFWTLMDTTPAPADQNLHAERLPDGGYKLMATKDGTESQTETTAEFLPVRSKAKTPIQTIDLKIGFTPSPQPTEGDRMRLTSLEATVTMGVNSSSGLTHFTYQDVRDFHIPDKVTIAVPGAFSLDMEYTNCKIRKTGEKKPEPTVETTEKYVVKVPAKK